MNNWKRYSVANLISDRILFIGDGYRAKNVELSDHGIPFARISNINDGFHFDNADRFPEKDLHKVGNKISQPGDVVFTSKGTVGRFALVREDIPRFVYSPQLCFWRVLDSQIIDSTFLFFWMFGREFLLHINGVKGQTDMADYVSLADQRNMQITLPPLTEQRAIAAILGALDDKIELNRRMNDTLEAMARAVFRQWFVENPDVKKWKSSRIRGFAFLDKGISYKGEFLTANGMPMINLGCFLGKGKFEIEKLKIYSGEYKEHHTVEPGDIVLANTDITQRREVIGSPALVPDYPAKKYLFTHHVYAMRVTDGSPILRNYLYFTLLQDEFRERAEGYATGTTVLALPRDAVLDYEIPRPPVDLLSRFYNQVDPMFQKMQTNIKEIRTLASLRDSLLPKLMRGEVRVKELEEMK